jgi:hypothetical protein
MDEMDVDAVDARHELRQRIEFCFRLPPVITAAPMLDERPQLGELDALRLIRDGFLIRPAGEAEAQLEIVKRGLRNPGFEWPHQGICHCLITCSGQDHQGGGRRAGGQKVPSGDHGL